MESIVFRKRRFRCRIFETSSRFKVNAFHYLHVSKVTTLIVIKTHIHHVCSLQVTSSHLMPFLFLLSFSLESNEKVVDTLEVVALSDCAPVWRYAQKHKLKVHNWPNVDAHGRFDVGVVVSFGCLLKEKLINQLPL